MKWVLLIITLGTGSGSSDSTVAVPGYATRPLCLQAATAVNTKVSPASFATLDAHCIPGPG